MIFGTMSTQLTGEEIEQRLTKAFQEAYPELHVPHAVLEGNCSYRCPVCGGKLAEIVFKAFTKASYHDDPKPLETAAYFRKEQRVVLLHLYL